MSCSLSFHGAAGTVTGSRFLLRAPGGRLLVDCGLFQGHKDIRSRNWEPPGFDPRRLDAVVLTHAHIDHSGYLPRLVRDGFDGPIHATPATADLADLLLRDAAMIQEEDAAHANRRGWSRHDPALPLFTGADAQAALDLFEVVDFDRWTSPFEGLRFRHVNVGHILGSGMVELRVADRDPPLRLLFSGDVGRYDAPLVRDPTPPRACDVLVVESTYGDRRHPRTPVQEQLAEILSTLVETGGTALIPAFAVGRSQQIVYLLREVMQARPELEMAIHLDSPMAIDTTKLYCKYPEESGLEDVPMRRGGGVLHDRGVYLHKQREESMRLNDLDGPRVLVSSSGMLTGGRVLHHLRRLAPHRENVIVLAGYQAPGTRGWRLERGEPTVRVHGRNVPIRAQVASISGLSAHADADQLLRWLGELPAPRRTFVVHGDPQASAALAERLGRELGHECTIPEHGQAFEL